MTHTVFCTKLQKEGQALPRPPYPGELGKKVLENISQEAWQMWLGHQTMLINEYRLNMLDPNARTFLITEMEKFLFGTGSEKPPQFNEK